MSIFREEIRWEDNQQVRVLERNSKSEFVTKTSTLKQVATSYIEKHKTSAGTWSESDVKPALMS